MNAETVQQVYAYLFDYRATHRLMPTPRQVYEVLGLTKRHYFEVLRWLEARGLVARIYDKTLWQYAEMVPHFCDCGVERTPATVVFEVSRGCVCVRRICRTCRRAQWADAAARRRQNIRDYGAFEKAYRLKRALKHRSAST